MKIIRLLLLSIALPHFISAAEPDNTRGAGISAADELDGSLVFVVVEDAADKSPAKPASNPNSPNSNNPSWFLILF